MRPALAAVAAADRAPMLGLLRELGDLKRTFSAGREGSVATRLFARGWAALAGGASVGDAMRACVSAALAAARLGDLDREALGALGLSRGEALAVLEDGFDAVAGPLDEDLAADLRGGLALDLPDGPAPGFVALLAKQPRAGVTCPGRARLMLQPAENHAEHSVIVGVYAALLAPEHGADPADAWMAAMAHHLHNALMPDSGFAGEMLLGAHLEPAMTLARDAALAELPAALAERARAAMASIADDALPHARAFHAADVLDRVLEIEQHLRAREASMERVLGEWELVHDGPVKPFHDRVLAEFGLS